jgi:FkbM family methyltransferase
MTRFLWGPEQKLIVPTPRPAFLMNEDDSGLCQMFRVGIPEHPLIEFCKQFANSTKRFIDGGAHMGAYSILLAEHFASVEAFEAQRRTYFQLCGNIFLNEKTNITPHNFALTNHEYTYSDTTLYIVSDDGGGSSTIKPDEAQIKSKETVETIHIDNFVWSNVGLIKMDVEGAELEAIQGARETLKRCKFPPILFESNGPGAHNQKRSELFKYLMNALPYQVGNIKGYDNMFIALRQEAA